MSTYPVEVGDGDAVPASVVDAPDEPGDDAGYRRAQGEGELQVAVDDLQGDKVMSLIVATVVEEQAALLSGGEPGRQYKEEIKILIS